MAYEYENETKNLITKLSGVWVESEKKEILKELQEVYRKAKAWDNYMVDLAKTDDESESLATVVLYHNQNPIAQGECYADAGNGDFYYSVYSLKIKDIHYPVVKH